MTKRDDLNLVADMIDNASDSIAFVDGLTFSEFCLDRKTKAAVLRCIQTIGEAASRVSQNERNAHPEIPWKEIIGMRNILVHRYFNLDDEAIWKVISNDLPVLLRDLKALRPQ